MAKPKTAQQRDVSTCPWRGAGVDVERRPGHVLRFLREEKAAAAPTSPAEIGRWSGARSSTIDSIVGNPCDRASGKRADRPG